MDNELYVRDYSKCILCYKCVEACGVDAQNTFAIAVAGRGFDARISTEFDVGLPDSACVYCGNCIGVCPTGALMFTSEHEMREAGTWDESQQTVTETICPYCGVGCDLEVHVQDNSIVKVTSPSDNDVTSGHLCIKGRFGFQFVQNRARRSHRREGGLPEVAGVVLAGGRSTRFGRDKLAETYRGMPLLHHAVLRLGEVCSEVVVVLAPDAPEPPMPTRRAGRFARDAAEGEGPLAGRSTRGCRRRGRVARWSQAATCRTCRPGCCSRCCRWRTTRRVEAVALQDGDRVPAAAVRRSTRAAIEVAHALLHEGRRALRDLLDALRTGDRRRGRRGWPSIPSAEPCSTSTSRTICRTDPRGFPLRSRDKEEARCGASRSTEGSSSRKRPVSEILPLDPRDPDVVHAKELIEKQTPPRRRAA